MVRWPKISRLLDICNKYSNDCQDIKMTHIRALFKQSSLYFVSKIIVMVAGFISFPIWTRVFSVEEYGIFSLITVTISLGIGFSKFGLQHAALRFYYDYEKNNVKNGIETYYSTLFYGSIFLSITSIGVLLIIEKTVLYNHMSSLMQTMVPLILFLIFIGSLTNVMTIFIRAQNKAGLHSIFLIAKRYGNLALAIVFVFYITKNVKGLFMGYALADALIFVSLVWLFRKYLRHDRISKTFIKEAISYGFPLIWMEISNMLLNFGDRYILNYYSGSLAVGLYSAGYNISDMSRSFLSAPLKLAIVPMFLKVWNKHGTEETRSFLNETMLYYCMIGVPIIVAISWYGKSILSVLASEKYQEASVIVPYILSALIIYGANPILTAGLRIYKKTNSMMAISLISAVVNILLNVCLIPIWGISGAAISTAISYGILVTVAVMISNRYLKIDIPVMKLVLYVILSGISILISYVIPLKNSIYLGARLLLYIIAYIMGIILIDMNVRLELGRLLKKQHG
jgi:O-antigen/teichoic acid export membrane protein